MNVDPKQINNLIKIFCELRRRIQRESSYGNEWTVF